MGHIHLLGMPHPISEPWAITPEGLQLVLSVWSRESLFKERLAQARDEHGPLANDSEKMIVENGVAVIPIVGPLFRKASMFTEVSAATSYGQIRKDLRAALADQSVARIVLRIDSPGGEVAGVQELASEIRAATAKKPIIAYAEGMCASAGYWLASAATKIVCGPTSSLGSIGVRIALTDDAKQRTDQGLRDVEIVSSQSPDKRSTPIDDDFLNKVQRRADALAQIFIDAVAVYRGVTPDAVVKDFGGGDVLLGADALRAGMADQMGSMDGLLSSPSTSRPVMRYTMTHLIGLRCALQGALAQAKAGDADLQKKIETAISPLAGEVQALLAEQDPAASAEPTPQIQDLLDLRTAVVKATGATDGLPGAVAALAANAKAAALVSERAQVAAVVAQCIADGQCPPAEREHYEAMSLANVKSFAAVARKNPPRTTPAGAGADVITDKAGPGPTDDTDAYALIGRPLPKKGGR